VTVQEKVLPAARPGKSRNEILSADEMALSVPAAFPETRQGLDFVKLRAHPVAPQEIPKQDLTSGLVAVRRDRDGIGADQTLQ